MNWLIQLAIMAVLMFVSYLIRPKQNTISPAKDLDLPIAQEGEPIVVVFGERWVKGYNVVWYGDLRTTSIKSSAGLKG